MAGGCLWVGEVVAVCLIELFGRAIAEFPERVRLGGAPIDQPKVVNKGITKPRFLAVKKKVGKSRDLAVDLRQSRVALEVKPAEFTELLQRNKKAIFKQAFTGGRYSSRVATTE